MELTNEDVAKLDNPVWHALGGPHAHLAQADATGAIRRYQPEVSIFSAVDRIDDDVWSAQAEFVGAGGVVVLFRDEVPPAPAGWIEEFRSGGFQLVANDLVPVPNCDWVELDAKDVDEMLELTQLTEPGPFLARTIELGTYRGVRRDGRLLAMAGQRFHLPGWTEVSAVCTHPDAQRQGLGAALTLSIAESIGARGERAFLHVLEANENATRLYEALGFSVRRKVDVVAARYGPSRD